MDSAETAVFSNRVSNGASEHAFGSAAAVPVNNDMGSSPFPILRRRQAKTPTTPPHQRGKTEARAGAMATASRFTTHRGDSDQTVPAGRSDLQLRMLLSCVTSPAALAHTWARSCSNMCFIYEQEVELEAITWRFMYRIPAHLRHRQMTDISNVTLQKVRTSDNLKHQKPWPLDKATRCSDRKHVETKTRTYTINK